MSAGGGVNTAIASGAAFGHAGGGGDIGAGDTKITIPGELGISGAAGFMGEKMSTMFNETTSLGGFGGLGLNNMSMLGKGKLFGIFSSIGGGEGGGDGGGGGGASSSGGGASSSEDSAPYSAMSGAMMPPGVAGGDPVPHDRLGGLTPDSTPSIGGRGQSVGRD